MVSVPVHHKQGEDHQGEAQQGAHYNQLIPVGFGFSLRGASLTWQDNGLLFGHHGCAGSANEGGALMPRLRLYAVIGQELPEALLHRPALVGLLSVHLGHHNYPPVRAGVEKMTSTLAVLPSPLGQVGTQLTGQHSKRVCWNYGHLTGGGACGWTEA